VHRPAPLVRVVLTIAVVLLARPAWAQEGIFQGMQKALELTASSISTVTRLPSGEATTTETTNLSPALRLNLDALVYPTLRLNAGGLFEINMLSTTIDRSKVNSTISRNRPFVVLRSTNPVFSPGFGYFRREERSRITGLSDVKLVNDEYAGYLGWNPAGGPRSDFQFVRTHTFDGTGAVQDVKRQFATLISNYTYGQLGASYRGAYLKTEDQLLGLETRQLTHDGRVSDSRALMNKRLSWNAAYNIAYRDVTNRASGNGGDVDVPLSPFAGLSSLSDTPAISRLSQNPQLIDGNLTAGAGVNIGLIAPPADTQARNIGLDFLNPAEVSRVLIWVNRDLPVEVSSSFTWEIYSSTDNISWRRETTASSAPFGPFENRFELVFPAVASRYLKVVTRPLPSTVPESSRYTEILVTEVQAFVRRPARESAEGFAQTTHVVNTDYRMRLLDTPSLYYEGFFLYNGPAAFGTSTRTLSNGASVSHTFARIFSAYARGAREQGHEPRGDRVATVTSATLTMNPIPTFRSTLIYTGQDETVADLPNDRRAFLIQNSAQLYRGIDILFGFGWNVLDREHGEHVQDRVVNFTATIVPVQRATLTLSYDNTSSERSGIFEGMPHLNIRRFYGALALDPLRTLHLAVAQDVVAVTDQRTRTTTDVSAAWAPFAGGALQLIVAHNEGIRAIEFGRDKNSVAAVRWNLPRGSYFDVSYQKTTSEFVFQTIESRVFSVTVRLYV
jgi:hypothetical protein